MLDYLAINTLSDAENKTESTDVVEELTDNLIQRIVELNTDMPLSKLQEKIGDKIAVIRYRKQASLVEIQNIFLQNIKNFLEKVESTKL